MHEYAACPLQDRHLTPTKPNQDPDDSQSHHGLTEGSENTQNHPSLDLSWGYLDDNLASSTPSFAQAKLLETSDQSPPSEAFASPTGRLGRAFSGGYSRWKALWRLQTVIIGFFLLLICATAHCWFFVYLDSRILAEGVKLSAKTTTIPQGYVTTISLLLVTAFRAALLASVGVCYTQYLWATLREHAFEIGIVEDLFQIQTNAFHLTSYSIYFQTPILAAVAVFCWLVPIAMVYPPGALVVGLQITSIAETFNVSVPHVKDPTKDTNYMSHVWCDLSRGPPRLPRDAGLLMNASFLETCYTRIGENNNDTDDGYYFNENDASYVTRSTLISGEIAKLDQPAGENSSYSLEFWGATLQCEVTNRTSDVTIFDSDVLSGDARIVPLKDAWTFSGPLYTSGLRISTDPLFLADNTTITYRTTPTANEYEYQYYPCLDSINGRLIGDPDSGSINLPDTGIHVLVPITETTCRPKVSRYSINITHSAGNPHVSHSISTQEPIPTYFQEYKRFNGSFEQWVQFSDAMTVYDEFARNLNKSPYLHRYLFFDYLIPSESPKSYMTSNGTSVNNCLLKGFSLRKHEDSSRFEIWLLSVFERRLPSDIYSRTFIPFDVDLANELLINSTISMLALNRRFGNVNGTTSRAFNAYHFRNKLAFFLPYSLSLGLAIPIIASGLFAFYVRNQRVSAISGGFLQILMTTTGRTELETIIMEGSGTMGGRENVSEKLKRTKIRFGKLIELDKEERADDPSVNAGSSTYGDDADDASVQHSSNSENNQAAVVSGVDIAENSKTVSRRAGFGMVHEVDSFRKKAVD